MTRFIVLRAAAALAAGVLAASPLRRACAQPAPPALAAIRESDLRRDLYAMAGDAMRGREAGTLDELRAAVWMADRAREAGLKPAGDDGTYFQWWPMRRVRLVPERSTVGPVGATPLAWGRDVVPAAPVEFRGELPLVLLGGSDTTTEVRGRAVVVDIRAPRALPPVGVSLRPFRYALTAIREQSTALVRRGASAVLLIGDSTADAGWDFAGAGLLRGRYNVDTTGAAAIPAGAPVLWVRAAAATGLRAAATAGGRLALSLTAESFVYPSANVVAAAPGRDPTLRGEYVVFSGHHDHDGVRGPVDVGGRLDSIWNGADDNASVDVAMLAAGRAFVKAAGAPLGALCVARRGRARAVRLALVLGAPDRTASVARRGAQRRHDRPQQPRLGGPVGRAAAAHAIRPTSSRSRSPPTGSSGNSRSTRCGTARRTRRAGTSGATTCPTRARAYRR